MFILRTKTVWEQQTPRKSQNLLVIVIQYLNASEAAVNHVQHTQGMTVQGASSVPVSRRVVSTGENILTEVGQSVRPVRSAAHLRWFVSSAEHL